MNKKGPIIIIEDDIDDQDMIEEIFSTLDYSNKIIFFSDGEAALAHLNHSEELPFLILSDINMPKLDGFKLKQKIHTDAELQIKCIPYLFFTTSASKKAVIDAYSMSVQGFFIKENKMDELRNTLRIIVEYWQKCYSPNQYLRPES
jgi:CheY-like chemotaxis protein